MTDTSTEAVERIRALLKYALPDHVGVQTGHDTSAPAVVFADADYEVGDGVCGLHASGKQATEPCIPYVRIDALVDALAERDALAALLKNQEPSDGRPCSTDEFLAVAAGELKGVFDFVSAVECWVEGDWADAVECTSLEKK